MDRCRVDSPPSGGGDRPKPPSPCPSNEHHLWLGQPTTFSECMIMGPNSTTVSFGRAGNATEFYAEGWSTPEQGFTWTEGSKSILKIPRPPEVCDYQLLLTIGLFLPPGQTWQRVGISINGHFLSRQLVSSHGNIALWLPAGILLASSDTLVLQFDLPDAARPCDFGINSDSRALAISLFAITLIRIESDQDRQFLTQIGWETESIGINCEYGLVQRRAGAEPIGLLRWSTSMLKSLIPALNTEFAGLGDADSMSFTIHGSEGEAQWMMLDQSFGFVFHTFTHPDALAEHDIRRRESRRLPRLVAKFKEDLQEGAKLFVYQGADARKPEDVIELIEAMKRYGSPTLLLVLADPDRNGQVYRHSTNLIVGYVDELRPLADVNVPNWPAWKTMLPSAYRLWRGTP